ncbi:MAG: gamma-glutamyltransferase [Burkholderiales bacterium PBB6]|nr:MAG: gamma-glutamyltransferase [Burkholderiales bacterium PBB6]
MLPWFTHLLTHLFPRLFSPCLAALLVVSAALGGCALQPAAPVATEPLPDVSPAVAPEAASGFQARRLSRHTRFAVAAANPLAAAAGARILREGGSALDAAVAVQAVLGLVEPQSSGIGGGAFLLHWAGSDVVAWDGRETAPAAASPRQFLQPNGRTMNLAQAVPGGLSVGVPGVLAMLQAAHREHGVLPWARLFVPAIELAEQGFAVSPRLHALLLDVPGLQADKQVRDLFFVPTGSGTWRPLAVGERLRNPAYAAVLRRVAQEGAVAFYTGPVARDVVLRVRTDPRQPGVLSEADLAAYQPKRRQALCNEVAQWRVCGMPPPSSGHLAVMQLGGLLGALQGTDWPRGAATPPDDELALHHYLEASRLAFADRAMHVGDPDFVAPPAGGWLGLLDSGYLQQRARLIGPRSMGTAKAGQPGGAPLAWGQGSEQPEHGTSHISIVDAQGRALAMTTTVEAGFGARLMSDGGTGLPGGFLLNNQLTDFNFEPADAQGRPVANRLEPGKRPRSSMSPTLVFDRASGALRMSLGSPGGAAIIHFTAKTLLAMTSGGMDPQSAIDLPNVGSFNGPVSVLEQGRFSPEVIAALKARGHVVVLDELTSGIQALQADTRQGGWLGGADPRREGTVVGD